MTLEQLRAARAAAIGRRMTGLADCYARTLPLLLDDLDAIDEENRDVEEDTPKPRQRRSSVRR